MPLLYHTLRDLSRGFLGAVGDSNPHFNFSPHLGDTLTCSPVCAGGATRTHIIPLPTQPKTPATDGRTRLERVEWHIGGTLRNRSTPSVFCTLIVSQLGRFVKGFFYLFSRNFLKCLTVDGDSHSPHALPWDYRTSLGLGLTSP